MRNMTSIRTACAKATVYDHIIIIIIIIIIRKQYRNEMQQYNKSFLVGNNVPCIRGDGITGPAGQHRALVNMSLCVTDL